MTINRRAAIQTVLIACAAFLSRPLLAEDPQDLVLHSDARLVLLDVSVKTHDGLSVSGLTKDQFRVFEDGKPQTITEFASNDIPVTIGILVDESFSMRPKRADVIDAATAFVTESNPHDEIFVLNFNTTVMRGLPENLPFTDDIQQLRAALYRGVPEGKTALNDAIVAGLEQLKKGRRDKKALVVISDGGDTASEYTRRELMEQVERNVATIYTIGIYSEDDQDRDPGLLSRLARVSGGEAYFPKDSTEMMPVCRRIARDIRSRYTIGYVPSATGGAALRHIRAEASAPGRGKLAARTRSGYRFSPAKETGQSK